MWFFYLILMVVVVTGISVGMVYLRIGLVITERVLSPFGNLRGRIWELPLVLMWPLVVPYLLVTIVVKYLCKLRR